MKICVIHSLFRPYKRGGAEVVVDIVVNELVKMGHRVVIITLGRKNQIYQEAGLTIYRINPLNVFSFLDIDKRPIWLRIFWHPLDVFNVSSYFKVKKILKLESPDVVMTHNLKGIGYLVPKAVRSLRLKHIHTIHDVQLSRPSGLILYGQEKPFLIIDKIYEKIVRALIGSPDIVVSPSRWLMGYYQARGFFYESKKIIMPNPIVFKKIDKNIGKDKPEGLVTLLFVGQIEQFKGILFLIEALKKVRLNNWRLQIIGSGNAQDLVQQKIIGDSRFEMVGRVSQEELLEYYRAADVTVVPSLCYENSPKVIDESLIANVPVIASDIGGVSEIVKDDYNGFTFAPGNEKNLIEVLEYFLSHPEKIDELKKNCFISVRNFSTSNYLKKLISL
ncbi:MAG: glycosyltransferase family 4 protein [Candidatus Buchananbacteria bacterium]|nr:glycosyltransferase family 4 protein [Candidatus Buchananbacteria bacterium]